MTKVALSSKNTTCKYSHEDKRAAMACYAVHGNFVKCSKILNIPDTTLGQWSRSEWWLQGMTEIRDQKQDEIDAGISNIIDLAIGSVSERIENGDEMIDSKGVRRFKAVSARDSATILGIAFDKQRILRMLPTTITASTDNAKLLKLQESFEQLAAQKTKEIEGTVVSEG